MYQTASFVPTNINSCLSRALLCYRKSLYLIEALRGFFADFQGIYDPDGLSGRHYVQLPDIHRGGWLAHF